MLAQLNVPATFFWLAQSVLSSTTLVRQAEARGHSLQHHSYSHQNLAAVSPTALHREVVEANRVLTRYYRTRPKYFRPPYGRSNSRVRSVVASEQLVSVLWNVDSLDWLDHNPQRVAERVERQMALVGRGIILFHDIHPHTVQAARLVLQKIKRSSVPIRFVTIDQAYGK